MGKTDKENEEYKIRENQEFGPIFAAKVVLSVVLIGIIAIGTGFLFFAYGIWGAAGYSESNSVGSLINTVGVALLLIVIFVIALVVRFLKWLWRKKSNDN